WWISCPLLACRRSLLTAMVAHRFRRAAWAAAPPDRNSCWGFRVATRMTAEPHVCCWTAFALWQPLDTHLIVWPTANCLAHGSDETYQPASPAFRMRSFPWEEEVVATFSHLGLHGC